MCYLHKLRVQQVQLIMGIEIKSDDWWSGIKFRMNLDEREFFPLPSSDLRRFIKSTVLICEDEQRILTEMKEACLANIDYLQQYPAGTATERRKKITMLKNDIKVIEQFIK